MAQPPIHEEEIINPGYMFKEIAPKLFLKLYTKERLGDYANKGIPKGSHQKDGRFEHGEFYGDSGWFFEMYLKYLSLVPVV